MKIIVFLFLFSLIISTASSSQSRALYSNCILFETSDTLISINTSGQTLWQICSPDKVLFDSSYSSSLSIITDSLNPYPPNASSYFTLTYGPPVPGQPLSLRYIEVTLLHRFQTDSLNDYGSVLVSADGGNSWVDLFSDSLEFTYEMHYMETTGDTLPDLLFTGNSNGWIRSKASKDLELWYVNSQMANTIDSLLFRFIFTSDAIQNNLEGWQIDNICIDLYWGLPVFENENAESFSIYPNPANNILNFETGYSFIKDASTVEITDISGRLLKSYIVSNNHEIADISELNNGIYFVHLMCHDDIISSQKLIITK
ncbi:MAG: T9SS type A sorting domain-containing protein [Bacteroidota bacterium]